MVRVVKISILFLSALGFSYAGDSLFPVAKTDTAKKFALKRAQKGQKVYDWAESALKDAAAIALLVKQKDPKGMTAADELATKTVRDDEVTERIKALLAKVPKDGWEEVAANLQALLTQKNLRWADLARNRELTAYLQSQKLLESLVSYLSAEEKKFWSTWQAGTTFDPITESFDEPTPSGALAEGLRYLAAINIVAKLQLKVEIDEHDTLLRYFLGLNISK